LACDHAVIDYELEGSKVKTNVLFEAATTAGNVKRNLFKIFLKNLLFQVTKYIQRQKVPTI